MRRSTSAKDLQYDPEIERTCRTLRRETRQRKEKTNMSGTQDRVVANTDEQVILDETSIRDYETPNPANCMYKTPEIGAAQFNINPSLIQMVSNSAFEGDIEREDPHRHLERFVQMCGSFRIN